MFEIFKEKNKIKESSFETFGDLYPAHELYIKGLWILDLENNSKEWISDEFWKILGYHEEKNTNTSEWKNYMLPEDLIIFNETLKVYCMYPEKTFDLISRYIHKDGTVIWLKCQGYAIKDQKGKPIKIIGSFMNITEFKNSEEILKLNEKKFRTYLEMAPDAIFITDSYGNIKEINNAACLITGYSNYQLSKMNLFELIDDQEKIKDRFFYYMQNFENGKKFELEYLVVCNGNKKKYISTTSVKIDDNNFMIFSKDISESRKLKNQMNLILNSSIDGCIIVDYSGFIINVNESFCSMSGYTKEEMLSFHVSDIIYSEPEINFQNRMEYLRTNGSMRYENIYKKKNGTPFYVDISINAINEDEELFFITFIRDITEKRRIESELRDNQALLKAALDNSHAGIAIADVPDGRLRYVNKAGIKIRDGKEEILVNNMNMSKYSIWNLYHFDETPYKNNETPLSRALLKGETVSEELVIKRDNGDNRIVWVNAAPVYDEFNTEIKAAIAVFLDITDKYRALESAKIEKQNAEKANLAKSQFLLNISHELRTPLNGILGFSEIIIDNLKDKENLEMMNYIFTSGKRLLNIINSLIDISNIEKKIEKTEKNIFNIKSILDNIMPKINIFMNNKNIKFIQEIDIDLNRNFIGDNNKIIKILENVISNAIKFTEKGMVKLFISELEENTQFFLKFRIEDTGIGMNKDELNRIYDLFWHGENVLTKKYSGLGIGFSIIKHLIELLKGELKVESQINHGTIVNIKIPVDFSQENESKTAYIADDDVINLKLLKKLCQKQGINVVIFDNGNELIENIKEESNCDLVIMDIQMPGLNGFKTAEILRKELNFDKPIIGISAYTYENTYEKCISAGMNDFIEKPISITQFNKKILKFIDIYSM